MCNVEHLKSISFVEKIKISKGVILYIFITLSVLFNIKVDTYVTIVQIL